METPQLNDHNKTEYPPMHTVEHILNQTMVRMFGCERSRNAHIERKKSKCDYTLPCAPTEEQIANDEYVDENTKDQPDGNNVDSDTQQALFAKNAIQYEAIIKQMNSEFNMMRTAMSRT